MNTKKLIKPALAAALAAGACSAFAQSSVTLYGIVDTAVERASNGAGVSVTRLVSGQGSASRLGFRGTEDLGGAYGPSSTWRPRSMSTADRAVPPPADSCSTGKAGLDWQAIGAR